MNLVAITAVQPAATSNIHELRPPRGVDSATAHRFDCLLQEASCSATATTEPMAARPPIELDIEKALLSHLPAPDASPAEFALGMLRAQVKVSQAAIGIELVSKTTQSLSQGVQSLTSR